MMIIELTNNFINITNVPSQMLKILDEETSYLTSGHNFSPAFINGYWDGKIHTIKIQRNGDVIIPIGFLNIVKKIIKNNNFSFSLKSSFTEINKKKFNWNDKIILRYYQKEAIEKFCSKPNIGRGILKMPIRSGKTKTAAGIIKRLGAKTLFIVPSTMLLYQTKESLKTSLPGVRIGLIGDKEASEGDITIITIQSLSMLHSKKKNTSKLYLSLINNYDMIIVDEIHKSGKGNVWRKVLLESKAKYRLGLSATVFFDSKKENETGVIWLRACCGDIKYEISTSKLIKDGYLIKQVVELYAITKPKLLGEPWSKKLRNEAIYENEYRNNIISRLAVRKTMDGLSVLIISNRLAQIDQISNMLTSYRTNHFILTGTTSKEKRKNFIESFRNGEVKILIGTVFGEGIDIPELECVIVAEGGKDIKSTIQRMRNMTLSEGKSKAILVDFYDTTNRYFTNHSINRIKTYESEDEFIVKRMWQK